MTKKSAFRLLLLVTALFITVLLVASCGVETPTDTTASTTAITTTTEVITTEPATTVTTAPITAAPVTTVTTTPVTAVTTAPVTTAAPTATLTFATLSAQGEDAYATTVSNATTEFSFRDEITAQSGVNYTVSRDSFGEQVIASKTATLAEGENVFYLFAEAGNDYRMYTVTIYRRPMHTVTFDFRDGSIPMTISVEEGTTAIQPDVIYPAEFISWDLDIASPITAPTTFKAIRTVYPITYEYAFHSSFLPYLTLADNPTHYAPGTAISLDAPTNEYTNFVAWTLNGEPVTEIPANADGPITLVATWQELHPECVSLTLVTQDTPFTGTAIKGGYGISNRVTFANVTYTFKMIDPVTGDVIEDLGTTQPIASGTYEVTATLIFKLAAKEEDKQYTLPAPMTARMTVTAGTLDAAKLLYGAKDTEIYFRDDLNFDPATSAIPYGIPSVGLERTYSIVKLASKEDTGAGTAVATAGRITAADGAGYYRVTIGYFEVDSGTSWTNEQDITHTAIVHVREIEKQVKQANGIVIDGVIDDAYRMSASYTTKYQELGDVIYSGGNPAYYELVGETVDPFLYAAACKTNGTADTSSATFYFLWGEEEEGDEKVPYIYIAIEVKDSDIDPYYFESPPSGMSLDHWTPWKHDHVELFYSLGDPIKPDVGYSIFENYVLATFNAEIGQTGWDSRNDPLELTPSNYRSYYYDKMQSATKGRTKAGDDTYVIELRIPARREGVLSSERVGGDALKPGDFIYFAYTITDDTNVVGNYSNYYLKNPAAAPMVLQLSDEWATN